ncbi:MAG: hypothetical protein RLW62_04375 [Gammaproteobacteria bacterium]
MNGADARGAAARRGERIALVGLLLTLLAAWSWLGIARDPGLWHSRSDYAYLSLAHALSAEDRVHGGPAGLNYGLGGHPGVPFFVASWASLRLAAPWYEGDLSHAVLAEPDPFWHASKLLALALTLCGVWLLGRFARPYGTHALVLGLVVLLGAHQEFMRSALAWLTNESFALPLAALSALVWQRLAREPGGSWAVAAGALGGLAYLVKLHYLALTVAGLSCVVCAALFRRSSWGRVVLLVGLFVLGLALTVLGAAHFIIGWKSFANLLEFHAGIFLHSGIYGSGEAGVFAGSQLERVADHVAQIGPVLPGVLLATLVLVAAVAWSRRDDAAWWRTQAALGCALAVATVSATAAVIKHYQAHYVVVPHVLAAVTACWLAAQWPRRVTHSGAVALVLVALLVTWPAVVRLGNDARRDAARLETAIAAIRALPLAPGEQRLWVRVSSAEYVRGWAVRMAGVRALVDWTLAAPGPDRSASLPGAGPWRYAIVEGGPERAAEIVAAGVVQAPGTVRAPLGAHARVHDFGLLQAIEL